MDTERRNKLMDQLDAERERMAADEGLCFEDHVPLTKREISNIKARIGEIEAEFPEVRNWSKGGDAK